MKKENINTFILVEKLNSLENKFRLKTMPKPCNSALDIGCGSGNFVREMITAGTDATGVDIDDQNFDISLGEKLIKADAHVLPFPNDSFDYVTSHSVYHELDPDSSLTEMIRVLKPGGVLSIIDVAMVLNQEKVLLNRVTRIRQQFLRRIAFTLNHGVDEAILLTKFLQSDEWKNHRKMDRATTLDDFHLMKKKLEGAEVGLTGNGVLAYINWVKS